MVNQIQPKVSFGIKLERKKVRCTVVGYQRKFTPYLQDTQGQEGSGDPREDTAVGVF